MPEADRARPRLSLLTPEHVTRVHQASLRVLAEAGVRVDSERARAVYTRAGTDARVDGARVRLGPNVVEWAIRASPASVAMHDRRGELAFELGDGSTRFGAGVTNLFFQDPSTDAIVPFAREHMRAGVRMCHALPAYDVVSTLGVLRDLPPAVADLYAVLELAANTTKPLVLLVSDEALFLPALELLETLAPGLRATPFVMPYLNPITPLAINAGTSDKLLESVARGLPVIYSNYGMAGMTTPLSCAGTLALLNAELLAGLVLGQLAREGTPMVLGSLPMFFDMKTMVDFYDPRTHLINLACAEMMAHYQIPHAGTSGSGDGWGLDLVAAGAQWLNQATSVIGRVSLAPFVGSCLNSKAWSPALTVHGDDVIRQARHLAQGFSVNTAELGVSEMLEALATEGHFLVAPTTLARYRGAGLEGLVPHVGLEKWVEDGCRSADRLVRERARELLASAEAPPDCDELLAKGEAFLARFR